MERHIKEDLMRDVELVEMIFGILSLILSSIILHAGTLDKFADSFLESFIYLNNIAFILVSVLFWVIGLAYITSKINFARVMDFKSVNLHFLVPDVLGIGASIIFTSVNLFLLLKFYT